jgi:hypothetical protein
VIEASFWSRLFRCEQGIWNPKTISSLRELATHGALQKEGSNSCKPELPIPSSDRIGPSAVG